ncbi:MAG: phosphoribosyl-AMP cyclohydrolase [Candidatus Berkelbacteria bacterium]
MNTYINNLQNENGVLLNFEKFSSSTIPVVFQKEDDSQVMAIELMTATQIEELLFLCDTGRCWRSNTTMFELWRISSISPNCSMDSILCRIVLADNINPAIVMRRLSLKSETNNPWFGLGKVVIPFALQDAGDRKVIRCGMMNREAYEETLVSEKIVVWSLREKDIWTLKDSDYNPFKIKEIFVDRQNNNLLFSIASYSHSCRKCYDSCFEDLELVPRILYREAPED